jgi:N-acetylglucosaminyldiphosphoundecaprenol N-acetyl-beta-D-mannosaminyltransferase
VRRINSASPDILWVGMTAPKQEKWIADNLGRLDVPVIGAIGAVFDFFAGTVSRAPIWMRRSGTEWVHRLATNPRRMWRRMFVSIPKFIVLALIECRNQLARKN